MSARLSIIVPVLNEEENIEPLRREIAAALAGAEIAFELVFVDDGSSDATWPAIAEAQGCYPWVRGLRHVQSFGQSAALWTGFQATQGEWIATLDGDLQNDPADLPKLLAELPAADFVCGIRTRRQDNWLRRVSSVVARLARRTVLGIDFQDAGCGLRVFKRWILGGVVGFKGLHRFLLLLAYWQGALIRELPVNHRPRQSGRSKYGIWNRLGVGVADLLAMAWFRRRRLPTLFRDRTAPRTTPSPATTEHDSQRSHEVRPETRERQNAPARPPASPLPSEGRGPG